MPGGIGRNEELCISYSFETNFVNDNQKKVMDLTVSLVVCCSWSKTSDELAHRTIVVKDNWIAMIQPWTIYAATTMYPGNGTPRSVSEHGRLLALDRVITAFVTCTLTARSGAVARQCSSPTICLATRHTRG
jgi:hypothetical protein